MAWDWIEDVAVGFLHSLVDSLVPSPREAEPSDPLRVRLWTLAGAVVLASAGALAALLLIPPVPPAGFFDTSADAMTKGRTVGFVGGIVGGLVVGGLLGRMVGRRSHG